MYKVTQTNGFRERYLSFLTCTTRLTPQENVFLNISINVYGDTLHGYVFACVSYRTLPLCSLTLLVFEIIICFPPALTYTGLISVQMTVTICFDKQNVNLTSVIFVWFGYLVGFLWPESVVGAVYLLKHAHNKHGMIM